MSTHSLRRRLGFALIIAFIVLGNTVELGRLLVPKLGVRKQVRAAELEHVSHRLVLGAQSLKRVLVEFQRVAPFRVPFRVEERFQRCLAFLPWPQFLNAT